MAQFAGIGLGLLALIIPFLIGSSLPAGAGTTQVTSGKPAKFCRRYNAETLDRLRDGRQIFVITITAFRPAANSTGQFSVNLLTNHGSSRQEIDRFAVFPLSAFSIEQSKSAKRFGVSLADHARWLNSETETCLEISFPIYPGKPDASVAEVNIEIETAPLQK
jgi:hypothetical protein